MRENQGKVVESQRGFSLVELICGVAITVMLVVGALTGVASHQTQRRMHGELILAMTACRNTLETLRAVDIEQLPSYNGRDFDVRGQNGQPHGLEPLPGDPDGMPGEISVIVDRTGAGTTVYHVTARVRWLGATRGGNFAMSALMGDRR